jgi:hypothetical protein
MKQIEPIDVWQNGTTKTAVKLQAQGTNVTLGNSASFYWQLLTEENYQVANGNIGISGSQYSDWGANDDYIYDIIAEDLNLVIVGDWVDPSVDASA